MYCKKCGKQIDADSDFCIHCGAKVASVVPQKAVVQKTVSSVNTQNTSEATEEKSSSKWGLWLLLPIVLVFIVVGIVLVTKYVDYAGYDDSSSIISRDLRSSDYTCTTSQDLTSYMITITPTRDIDSCNVELTLYNSSGQAIFSDTISKTKLKEGSAYTYKFEFGVMNSLSGNKVKYNITGKC